MNEAKSSMDSEAHANTERSILDSVRVTIAWCICALIVSLFIYRLLTWILASLFLPAASDMALYGFRYDYAIRSQVPTDRPWFISSGFIAIVRFLRYVPFEYRLPAIHLLDDTLLIGFFVVMAFWSRRVFSTFWPAVIGTSFIIGRLLETPFYHMSDRDWYAAVFAFSGVLAAGSSTSRFSAILGATLWMIGLQFRPQTGLLLPCLLTARLGLRQADSTAADCLRKAIVDTSVGLAAGFVLVHVPLWIMGGFPAYYRDTFIFLNQGGHAGSATLPRILNNVARLALRQNDLSWIMILPAMAFLCVQSGKWKSGLLWLLTALYFHLVSLTWTSVNVPAISIYQEYPMFFAEAITLGMFAGYVSSICPDRYEPARILTLVFCFSLAFWSHPVISVQSSAREAIAKIRNHDFTPISIAAQDSEFPPAEWEMDRNAQRALFEFLDSQVDSETMPFEKIDWSTTSRYYDAYYLRNPGVVGNVNCWVYLLTSHYFSKPGTFEIEFPKYLSKLKSVPDGFVFWIPSQAKSTKFIFDDKHDITAEVLSLFETIQNYYEPVARFGEVEIRRKKKATPTSTP